MHVAVSIKCAKILDLIYLLKLKTYLLIRNSEKIFLKVTEFLMILRVFNYICFFKYTLLIFLVEFFFSADSCFYCVNKNQLRLVTERVFD